MKWLKRLGGVAKAGAAAAVAVAGAITGVPAAELASGLIVGAIAKHGSRLPNGAIPVINALVAGGAALVTGSELADAALAAVRVGLGATGAHQVIKIAARASFERAVLKEGRREMITDGLPRALEAARRIGPGSRLSL